MRPRGALLRLYMAVCDALASAVLACCVALVLLVQLMLVSLFGTWH